MYIYFNIYRNLYNIFPAKCFHFDRMNMKKKFRVDWLIFIF